MLVREDGRVAWESAVLVAVPELAAWTDPWRSGAVGESGLSLAEQVPPHVTVLVPWARVDDAAALERLAEVAGSLEPVEVGFTSAGVFPGGTVFLEPSPDLGPMVRAVLRAFPEFPPYDGDHPDPHPHLTVSSAGGAAVLAEVEAALAAGPPPPSVLVDHLHVYAPEADGVWRERDRVRLGR